MLDRSVGREHRSPAVADVEERPGVVPQAGHYDTVAEGGETAERFARVGAVEHALGAALEDDDARRAALDADGSHASISHGGCKPVALAARHRTAASACVHAVQVVE